MNTTRVPLAAYEVCLKKLGLEMDMDEVECIVASLIYKGYIKGYLSHQHKKLVVDKKDPFPKISKQ